MPLTNVGHTARGPLIAGGMVCRTRYIDEALVNAVSSGIRQVVILGAGMDLRPYRLAALTSARMFECDLPDVIDEKRRAVTQLINAVPGHVCFVPIDFGSEHLATKLEHASVDGKARTIFVLEGLTQYLSESAVNALFSVISQMPSGSEAVFTYVLKEVIDGTSSVFGMDAAREVTARVPWVSGFDPALMPHWLRSRGLELQEDVDASDYHHRYLAPRRRRLTVFEIERVVRAQVI